MADLQELYSFIMCSLYPFSDLVKEPLFFLKISRRYGKSAAYSYRKNILFVQYTTYDSTILNFKLSKILKKITQEPEYKA